MQRLPPLVVIAAVVLALMLVWLFLRARFPSTHALLDDWYNHGRYFLVFVFGYLFALQPRWWQFVIDRRRVFLCLGVACYLLILAERNGAFPNLEADLEAHLGTRLIVGTLVALNHWAWIFCVVGLAGRYLNRPSPVLRYSNPAILPWYILHQTLIIVFAWWLKPFVLPIGLEALVLLVLTVAGCIGGYAVIQRVNILRWLCGMSVGGGGKRRRGRCSLTDLLRHVIGAVTKTWLKRRFCTASASRQPSCKASRK
ncbi:hypothetical protein [Microbulbifer taiwanensis]|uniref:hypothetical protein n=1 Tax=Microbulbifer taiwanensis TaxID=986746 RepID=UPI00361B7439